MSLRDLKVGDTVIMVDANDRHYENGVRLPQRGDRREVVKVGRKLLHVANGSWKPRTFDLDVGAEQGPGINSGHVYTVDQWNERHERNEVLTSLRELGIELRGGRSSVLSLTQLKSILTIVEA